ncbi:85/88 kDa calcium-independent phospholipase A2-like protein [Leptotrombidium deliense]|uniref:phospholipase A2 n=1 Tax=Leptotrombidium deliense TaxID=299467 RepID=A0A443SUT9_9ACAR|nr:85/88 kDa calcium-independent phospholipase A2-like protein [Leptotrombidium deliense]
MERMNALNPFKFLRRFRHHSTQEKDLFADPWRVVIISKRECEPYQQLHNDEFMFLVARQLFTENDCEVWFEVWLRKHNITYSLHRSRDVNEIKKVYRRLKVIVNTVMKYTNIRRSSSMLKMLKEMVATVMKANPLWTAAHVAAKLNLSNLFTVSHKDIVRDLNQQPKPDFLSPLHIAIKYDNLDTVKALLNIHVFDESIVDIRLRDLQLNTILHLAAIASSETLKAVLNTIEMQRGHKKLMFLKAVNNIGFNPIQMAAYKDRPENVKQFLKSGLPVDLMLITPFAEKNDTDRELGYNDQEEKFLRLDESILIDIDNNEMKFGGNPLHWVNSRKSLQELINIGVPMKARNMHGETVLHVAVRKKQISNYIFILCSEHSLKDCRTNNGSTALHYAVSAGDVTAVQALTVFDVNVDQTNDLLQTARHISASNEDAESMHILHILHCVEARRCPASSDSLVCFDGCSHDGTFNGTQSEKWPSFAEEKLYDQCYNSVVEEAIKKSSDNKKATKMICFDGGGVKGVFAVQMLIELEKLLNKPINDCFNWMSGTSAGSVIASLLAIGFSPTEMRKQVLLRFKDKIFKDNQKKYDMEAANAFLRSVIGEETVLNDIQKCKLLIFACCSDRIPFQLHSFRNYKSGEEILSRSSSDKPRNEKLWKACSASGAIPFDSKTANAQLIDGGIIANNPTVDTLSEFTRRNFALKTCGRSAECEQLKVVVSLGTGRQPLLRFKLPKYRINILAEYTEFANLFIQQTTNANYYVVQRAESWCASLSVPFFRINPPFNEIISAFETDDSNIINGLWITKAYMHAMRPQLSQIISLIQ